MGILEVPLVGGPLVVTAPANNDRVLFWGDLSNEENHARVTNVRTSGREPHFKTNAQNGLPAIQFADDYLAMSNGDSASFDGLETYTFMVVAKGKSSVRLGDPFFRSVEMVVWVGSSVHAVEIPG